MCGIRTEANVRNVLEYDIFERKPSLVVFWFCFSPLEVSGHFNLLFHKGQKVVHLSDPQPVGQSVPSVYVTVRFVTCPVH